MTSEFPAPVPPEQPVPPKAPDQPELLMTPAAELGQTHEDISLTDKRVWVSAQSNLLTGIKGIGRENGLYNPDEHKIEGDRTLNELPNTVFDLLNLRLAAQMGVPPQFRADENGSIALLRGWDDGMRRRQHEWKSDLPVNAEGKEIVNPYLVYVDGYTVLSFGVPGGDARGGIYNFAMEGTVPYDEAVGRAKATFPRIVGDATDKGYALPTELAASQIVDVEALRPGLMAGHQEWAARQAAVLARAKERQQAAETAAEPAVQQPPSNTPEPTRVVVGRPPRNVAGQSRSSEQKSENPLAKLGKFIGSLAAGSSREAPKPKVSRPVQKKRR